MSSDKEIQTEFEIRKKKRLKIQFNNSRSWPTCFEKSLISIIYHTSLTTQQKLNFENLQSILLKDCDTMLERLNIEGFQNEDYKDLIERLKSDINNKNEQSFHDEMKKMLNNLRLLDISRIKELIIEMKKACYHLGNEDIILFLGKYIVSESLSLYLSINLCIF